MKVKVDLDENQTPEEAEELLIKALHSKSEHNEEFLDPAMQHQADLMRIAYKDLYESMLKEIFALIDED